MKGGTSKLWFTWKMGFETISVNYSEFFSVANDIKVSKMQILSLKHRNMLTLTC